MNVIITCWNQKGTVWEKLMLGLTTRKYGDAVRQFTEAYGLEKSAVSEHFIEASRVKLKQLMERRLEKRSSVRCWSMQFPSRASRWLRHWVSAATGRKRFWASGRAPRRTRPL
jgi:hypothetical protein